MKNRQRGRAQKVLHRISPTCGMLLAALAVTYSQNAYSLVISEDFTGGTTTNQWLMPLPGDGVTNPYAAAHPRTVVNNACLTAGTGSSVPTATVAGSPPKCSGVADPVGGGALRLTPIQQQMVGGIVSNFTFPTNDGVEITFTTYTWGGTGADGMAFFLVDGNKPATLGASGGSLGYTCARDNPVFSGIDGAYMGIGIDEWGNFVNQNDNSSTGIGFHPNTIGIRGAGSFNYNYMSNPDRFLQDVYTRLGWGTVPRNIKDRWYRDWTDRSNWGQFNTPLFRRLTNICGSGKVRIDGAYLAPGRRPVELSTTATDPRLKLYGYKYIASKTLPNNLATTGAQSRGNAVPMLYRIRITPDGKASVWYSYNAGEYQPVLLDYDIVRENGYLPDTFRFGFMGSTGGSTNNHEVTCFKAAPATQSEGSADVNLPDAKIVSDSQVYLSFYNKTYWTGAVTAQDIVRKPDGTYAVQGEANWDAGCVLTGGECERLNKRQVTRQTPEQRKFFTWNGSAGIPLEWGSLTPAQQRSLYNELENPTIGQARLSYIKGDTSLEQGKGGNFRARQKGILGDIINSSPVWVGYPSNKDYLFTSHWRDQRSPATAQPENSGQTYTSYAGLNQTRRNVVYTGSNDGFLHAFSAGSYDASKNFQSAQNDGKEVFAYMPAAVLSRIHKPGNTSLDFAHHQYAHNYYNDAPVGTGDVFYNGAWHTWLMSGLGLGGDTVYALDITDPTQFGADKVIGEWSRSNGGIWQNLGNSHGTPVFGRFHNGQWGAVFGNGWCSTADAANGNCTASAGPAGIYVMSISQNGTPSFKFISTGESGTLADPNGIAYVTPVDLDGDNIYDYAYAGDLKGNVWRFNLLADSSDGWASTSPQKIFGGIGNQPITTKIIVTRMGTNGTSGDVILNFGTGRRIEGYLGGEAKYATTRQSVYGVRDRTAMRFATESGNSTAQVRRSQMQAQTVDTNNNQLSDNAVRWNENKSGWYMDLPLVRVGGKTEAEQVIYNPYLERGKYLIVNTFINGSQPILSCTTVQSTGYTYPLNASSGTGVKGFFDGNFTGPAYRMQLNAVGAPILLRTSDGKLLMLTKDQTGKATLHEVFLREIPTIRRISWREIF